MARGKVQMKKIENPVHRQVTFCKRRAGLFKKARELSVLCDADIGIIVFSNQGKLFELSTKGTMQEMIERYNKTCEEISNDGSQLKQTQDLEKEVSMLKQEINLLQKGLRYILGEGESGPMTLHELLALERHLESWMYQIRTIKMQTMFQEIQSLKKKEGVLKAANEVLQEKIVEQTGHFDVAPVTIEQNGFFNVASLTIDQTGFINVAPMIADIQYPLTIHNGFWGSALGYCPY